MCWLCQARRVYFEPCYTAMQGMQGGESHLLVVFGDDYVPQYVDDPTDMDDARSSSDDESVDVGLMEASPEELQASGSVVKQEK